MEAYRESLLRRNTEALILKEAEQSEARTELKALISEGVDHENLRPFVTRIGKNRSLLRRLNRAQLALLDGEHDFYGPLPIGDVTLLQIQHLESDQAAARRELRRAVISGTPHEETRPLRAAIRRNRADIRNFHYLRTRITPLH